MKAISTKYRGPTDTRGGRIIASDSDNNRVTIPYPHELNSDDAHRKAAEALREKMGWTGELIEGGTKGGSVFVFLPTLYRFTFKFHGRQKGAIGIFHDCEQTTVAANEREAALKLYDTHEHITLKGTVKKEVLT